MQSMFVMCPLNCMSIDDTTCISYASELQFYSPQLSSLPLNPETILTSQYPLQLLVCTHTHQFMLCYLDVPPPFRLRPLCSSMLLQTISACRLHRAKSCTTPSKP